MSLIIESYKHKYTEINILHEFGKLFLNHTIVVGNGLSVDMYRIKEYIKKSGNYSITLIEDRSTLHNLADISIKIAKEVTQQMKNLELMINKDTSQEQLSKFYTTWRKLFLNFFPMQVLPLAFERSLKFNKKDILLKNKDILIKWRKETQGIQMQLEKIFKTFLKQVERKLKQDIRYLSDKEVIKLLAKEKTFNENDIILRKEKYLMVWDFESEIPYSIYTGNEIIETIIALENKKNTLNNKRDILNGNGIGSGSCEAPVYILKNKSGLDKIPSNYILVTKVLELEDIHKLKDKKICGVVTEEGGITSHIAISGRELNIPIVSAVKNITNLIRKDDIILIDANEGKITIKK